MKIVIMHYHLKSGGVSTVIRQQIEALKEHVDILVIAGRLPAETLPVDAVEIPALFYTEKHLSQPSAEVTARKILHAISAKWPEGCDLIHVHNPLLAKNRQLLDILSTLQANGQRLFLQIHDFAEDGRPAAYYDRDYPADCHYGIINRRDYRILQDVGLDPGGLHFVPNAVRTLVSRTPAEPIDACILYPVRGLRRKNIGEAILLSNLSNPSLPLAVTLPPNSPQDIASYNDWRFFCQSLGLNVLFDHGRQHAFAELLEAAHSMLTTSISEGFGFAFLEPWTAGKFLWGRRLADICSDFEAEGVQLDHLYDTFQIPLHWLEEDTLRHRWTHCLWETYLRFNARIDKNSVDAAWEITTAEGLIDFGVLAESMQRNVIRRVIDNPAAAQRLKAINPWLKDAGRIAGMQPRINRNRRALRQLYSLDAYRRCLMSAYAGVVDHTVRHYINRAQLLGHFLRPERFSLLKWEHYGR